MIKRPLATFVVVFILILLGISQTDILLFSQNPVNTAEDGQKSLQGYLQDDVITLYGVISDYSYQVSYGKKTTQLILKDVSVLNNFNQYEKVTRRGQSILVYINKEETRFIGSTVLVSGGLSFFQPATNPGQFDAEKYYENRDCLFALKNASIQKATNEKAGMRQRLKDFALTQEKTLEQYLTQANATIMKAMLLGNKEELDEEIKKLYQDNGIAHILAISGLHISLLGMAVYRFLRRLPLPIWAPLILSEIFLLLYGCMVGFPISSIRAIGMFTFFLLSKLTKRSYDMLTALACMALIQLLHHPGYLFDCGFQLSYGAILGISLLLPSFEKINESITNPWLKKGISFLLPSMSVTLVTSPILIYHYHELSFFSILLNLIVLPFMSLLLMTTIAMLFLAQIFAPLAKLCAVLVTMILGLYEYSCRFLEWFPIGQKNIAMPSGIRIFIYFMLLFLMTYLVKKKSHPYQFLFAVLSFGLLVFPQNPQFRLWITDIGQGDCSVIFTEEGNCFVIDSGSTTKYRPGERILIPFLKYHGVDKVDAVFVTHPDADHMNGVLELLELGKEENIEVQSVVLYEKAIETEPKEWEELVALAREHDTSIVEMAQGDRIQTDSVTIECLYPLREQSGLTGNASSLVLSLEARVSEGISREVHTFRALFTGDLEAEGEEALLQKYKGSVNEEVPLSVAGNYDLLKVGHHGSAGSSSVEFLEWVSPDVAVISCGKDNIYGHPHKETLERLKAVGSHIVITADSGAVSVDAEKRIIYHKER